MYAAVKAGSLLLVAPLLASAAPAPDDAYRVFRDVPGVYRVDCAEGRGTAFRVRKNHFFSVAHVTAMHQCNIEGHPITVTEQDGANDFSQLDADLPGPVLRISCEGYHAGEWVWSTGYAGGMPFQTGIALYPTYMKDNTYKRVLVGPYAVIPGMSGGPVFNGRGEVVGLVNAYIPGTGISFSRDLRDTSACRLGNR